jgi:hypothetical protein
LLEKPEVMSFTTAQAVLSRIFMKKIVLGILVVLMLAGPALAAPARPKPPKAKIGRVVAPKAFSGYRMKAAINRAGLSKKGAALSSEQARTHSRSSHKIGPELAAGASQMIGPALQPSGDRPFDIGAPALNPFAPPGSLPGDLWSPPVPLESGINPFQPVASSVNPFQSISSTAGLPAPSGGGLSLPTATNNPAAGGKAVHVTQPVNKAPNPLRSLWSSPLPGKASLALPPAGSPSTFLPTASPRNPFSPATPFSGSPFRLPTTP